MLIVVVLHLSSSQWSEVDPTITLGGVQHSYCFRGFNSKGVSAKIVANWKTAGGDSMGAVKLLTQTFGGRSQGDFRV